MIAPEVSPPRRPWLLPVGATLALACVAGVALPLMSDQGDTPNAPAPAVVAVSRTPPPAPPSGAFDERIALIAAASDAPVIAVASNRRVWISRDDGKTFTRALDSDGGEINALFIEAEGRVYVQRSDWGSHGPTTELGIAEPDGRERWREPRPGSLLLDARAGWIVGMAGSGGMVVGWNAGDNWERIPATHEWNPWRMTMGKNRVSYYLATKIGGERGMHLLAASERERAKVLWSLPAVDAVGTPDSIVPCAAFAGDTLHVVVRGGKPGSGRLVAVVPDGRKRERALVGQLLDDRELRCEIAGNDRAAYMTLRTYRTMHRVVRIDRDEPRDVAEYGFGFDRSAVDAHGNLLFLANGCLQRLSEAGHQSLLACGPDRR
jgi:hypothetical protein